MKKILILVLMISLLGFSLAFSQDYASNFNKIEQITDYKKSPSNYYKPKTVVISERSPYVAGVLGFMAGFGLGDFYAEDPLMGWISFGTEMLGIGLFATGWAIGDDDNDGLIERSELSGDDFSAGEAATFYSGIALIVASRIFGCITGVLAAKNFNKMQKETVVSLKGFTPTIAPQKDGVLLGLNYRF